MITITGSGIAARAELRQAQGLREPVAVVGIIAAALMEDLRDGPDLTTMATVPADIVGVARITARRNGVLAGVPIARAVFAIVDATIACVTAEPDGALVASGDDVLVLRGPLRNLLTGERVALNLLTMISDVATATRDVVRAVAHTSCQVYGTRRTLPALRDLHNYGITVGDGSVARDSLGTDVVITSNHIAAAGGSVAATIRKARHHAPDAPLQVEVDTLDQLTEALGERVPVVMLNDFSVTDCATAVTAVREWNDRCRGSTRLRAPTGSTLEQAVAIADTGVHELTLSPPTHPAASLDLRMSITATPLD